MKLPIAVALATAAMLLSSSAHALWINEFHYDNAGADVGEFVEVAGVAGTDLSGFSLELYNGATQVLYASIPLTGTIDDEGAGFGAVFFLTLGLQNGSPDGIALVGPGATVLEFLSYEGSFTANGGPADGLLSTDVGVIEASTTSIGESLQRIGALGPMPPFLWTGPLPESPGTINAGQTIPEPGSWLLGIAGSLMLTRRAFRSRRIER